MYASRHARTHAKNSSCPIWIALQNASTHTCFTFLSFFLSFFLPLSVRTELKLQRDGTVYTTVRTLRCVQTDLSSSVVQTNFSLSSAAPQHRTSRGRMHELSPFPVQPGGKSRCLRTCLQSLPPSGTPHPRLAPPPPSSRHPQLMQRCGAVQVQQGCELRRKTAV